MSLVNLNDPNASPNGASPSVMLTLDPATLQKLGLSQMPAGTQVFVTARAVVQNDPMNPNGPGGLQMVSMGIEPIDASAAQRLWGSGAPGSQGGGGQGSGGGRNPAQATPVSEVSAVSKLSDGGGSIMLG